MSGGRPFSGSASASSALIAHKKKRQLGAEDAVVLSRRANQSNTKGTYSHVAKAVRRRYGNKIASVGKARRTTTRPGYRKTTRRHRRKKYGGPGL